MQLTTCLNIVKNPSFHYRIFGYWRSPGILERLNLWSNRQDQLYRNMLLAQRGKGKGRSDTVYEKLSKPKYNIKWVRKSKSD